MKIWTALLICVMVAGLFFASGCIGDTTGETTPTEQPAEQASEQTVEETSEEEINSPEFEDNDVDFGELI